MPPTKEKTPNEAVVEFIAHGVKNLLEKGVNRSIEKHKVPLAIHLKAINEFRKHLDNHQQFVTEKTGELQSMKNTLASYENEVRRLHTLPHIKGEKGDTPKIDEEKIISQILAKVPKPKNGKSVNLEDVVQALIPYIPKSPKTKQKETNTEGLAILVAAIIKEKKMIDISDLKNAQSFMFGKKRYKIEELMHGGGSGGSVPLAYDISTQFNGVATTFTLPAYSAILEFQITGWYPNGALRPTVDFTTPSTTTVTLTGEMTAPASGTRGIILYIPT